ncbi:MAG: hypothetical protein ABIP75_14210 [Pyrinomonadaceae bacterium]
MNLISAISKGISVYFITSCLLFTAVAVAPARSRDEKQKLTVEEVVAKHLAALGTPEARAAVKSQLALGNVISTLKLSGGGSINGSAVMASTSNHNLMGFIYNRGNYLSERMAFDGKKLTTGESSPGTYPRIARYFKEFESPMRDGPLGGVLSTAWPLLDLAERKPKLKYNGTKKIDGRETYMLRFEGKNSGGLVTTLYFDAQTFRHVRTEYERRKSQLGVTQAGQTQQQGDGLIKLTEWFSDFAVENGLDLPHTYKIELSIELQNERWLQTWDVSLSKFVFNKEMVDAEFDVNADVKK